MRGYALAADAPERPGCRCTHPASATPGIARATRFSTSPNQARPLSVPGDDSARPRCMGPNDETPPRNRRRSAIRHAAPRVREAAPERFRQRIRNHAPPRPPSTGFEDAPLLIEEVLAELVPMASSGGYLFRMVRRLCHESPGSYSAHYQALFATAKTLQQLLTAAMDGDPIRSGPGQPLDDPWDEGAAGDGFSRCTRRAPKASHSGCTG